MKFLPLIITCTLGLVIGILVGNGNRAVDSGRGSSNPIAKPEDRGGGGGRVQDVRSDEAARDDERIGRVFSALQETLVLKKRAELFEALGDLTAQDLPSLVQRVDDLPFFPRDGLIPVLLDRWFELDFDAARNWMRAHPKKFRGIEGWVKANPEAAMQEAISAPENGRSARLLSQAIAQLEGNDPAAQAARLKALPPSKLRDEVYQGVLTAWAKNDPAAAFAALAEIPPGRTHDSARDATLREWAEHDPAAALEQVNALLPTLHAGVLGNDLITDLAERIGKNDPKLVLDWLSELPVEFRTAPAIGAARVWAATEPAQALDWCLANGVDVARGRRDGFNAWQAGVLGEAVAAHPDETIAWLEALPAGPNRDRLLERGLADSIWLAPKDRLFSGDAPIALRLFTKLPEDGQIRAATSLGEARASQGDLADFASWAQNFPPGLARANAVAGAMSGTFKRDASQAESLLSTITSVSDRDAALRGLSGAMSDSAPAEAAQRALAIADAEIRREALETVIGFWQRRDAETTRAWLESEGTIPAAWKHAWLQTK